jgi:hypothetical protein
MSSAPPRRHWRSYGNDPLPTGAEALDEPFAAFPSWFLRVTCDPPRHTRRLSDKILIAFHQACDWADFEVAERLLKVVEMVLAVPRPIDRERGEQEALVAAHERLWQLRHPDAGKEGMTLRPNYGRPHDDGLPTARTARRTGYVRALVICNSCRHQADADLQAIVKSGRGDMPLTELRCRCSQCGTYRTDFVVTSRENPQPW